MARAVALAAKPEQKDLKGKWLSQLTDIYKDFHSGSDPAIHRWEARRFVEKSVKRTTERVNTVWSNFVNRVICSRDFVDRVKTRSDLISTAASETVWKLRILSAKGAKCNSLGHRPR